MTDKEKEKLAKRREKLEEDLRNLQQRIFDLEGAYLEDTQHGNVIKGWDNFIVSNPKQKSNAARKAKINDKERIFSFSSIQFKLKIEEMARQAALELANDAAAAGDGDVFMTAADEKKSARRSHKKKIYDDDSDASDGE